MFTRSDNGNAYLPLRGGYASLTIAAGLLSIPLAVPVLLTSSSAERPEVTKKPVESGTYDVQPCVVEFIEPGACISGDSPPQGWSHLVLKTNVAVTDDTLLRSDLTRAMCQFFSALAAHVEKTDNGCRLAKIGMGSGMRTAAGDTIVTRACGTAAPKLGFLAAKVLRQHEEHIAAVKIRVRSDTMAIVDDATWLHRDGGHFPVVIRYALLLEPATGALSTLVWRIDGDEEKGYEKAVGPIECLPANARHEYALHVDGCGCLLGMPLQISTVAITRIPLGHTKLEMPQSLREPAGCLQFTQASASALESGLRELLKSTADRVSVRLEKD